MKSLIVFILLFCFNILSEAQPFVDLINVRNTYAFKNPEKSGTPFSHLYIGSDLPLKLKNNKYIILSPFYEKWNIDSSSYKNYLPSISSIALAVSFMVPLDNNHCSLVATAIPRWNSEGLQLENSFQLGGAVLANYKITENKKYKLGVYVNKEFFGTFIMPLVGIEWKINNRNYLYGVLPGKLTYEHKINHLFYTGGNFRAITNSYHLSNGNYVRIDDNQLSAYVDYYATKNIVLSTETGYGIMRQLSCGKEGSTNYQKDYNWGDGFFIKLCASYRIRL